MRTEGGGNREAGGNIGVRMVAALVFAAVPRWCRDLADDEAGEVEHEGEFGDGEDARFRVASGPRVWAPAVASEGGLEEGEGAKGGVGVGVGVGVGLLL